MLSLVFWVSLLAVFFVMKWLAEGLMSLARVEIRLMEPDRDNVSEPGPWRDPHPLELDEAA